MEIILIRKNLHSHPPIARIYFPQTKVKTFPKINKLSPILNFNLRFSLIFFPEHNKTISSPKIILHFLKISPKLIIFNFLKISPKPTFPDFPQWTKINNLEEGNLINLEMHNKTMEFLKVKTNLLKIIIRISDFKSQWICKQTHTSIYYKHANLLVTCL